VKFLKIERYKFKKLRANPCTLSLPSCARYCGVFYNLVKIHLVYSPLALTPPEFVRDVIMM
jgi:hypothetical protein